VRLYLSSYRVGGRAHALRAPAEGARAGLVFNALDAIGPTRGRNLPRETDDLEQLGYRCEELDLREYVDDDAGLGTRLQGLDTLWVVGGNAFVLAHAMARAGFRAALLTVAERAGFTYAGYSAGACVAGPDLAGIDLMDDPGAVPGEPKGRTSAVPCLGLVPFRIVPHWCSDHPESPAAGRAVAHLTDLGLAHRRLRDGEVVVVEHAVAP
jgi:dipeptidase E